MFKAPFSLKGRITRTEISVSYFFSFIALLFWLFFFSEYFYDFPALFFIPPLVVLFWFLICQGTKRCHDIGHSGFFQFIPGFCIVMIFKEGEKETNRYGTDPKRIELELKNFFTENFHFRKPEQKSWILIITEFFGAVFFTMFFISLLVYFFEQNQYVLYYGSALIIITCYYIFLFLTKVKEEVSVHPSYFFYERIAFAIFIIGFYHFHFYFFRDVVFEEFTFFSNVFTVLNLVLITYLSLFLFKTNKSSKIKFKESKQVAIFLALFFVSTFLVGYNTKGSYIDHYISWSEKKLEWKDFESVLYLYGGFDASINSNIQIPNKIGEDEFYVYTYMIPSKSNKLLYGYLGDQLLIHEQYHFNITEYVSREMRKELVLLGKENLSMTKLKKINSKYLYKIDSLQSLYDYETKHNVNYEKQRYWELKIDDLLRKTSYYKETDLIKYHAFNPVQTNYYKSVIQTFEGEVLLSYPVSEFESTFGKVYEVEKSGNKTIVTYYENGIKKNGGYFDTAITNIVNNKNSSEITYLNEESEYNKKLKHAKEKAFFSPNGNVVLYFFDEKDLRIPSEGIFEIHYKPISENVYFTSYYNTEGELIENSRRCFHEKRTLDTLGRLIKIESFDRNLEPILNNKFVSVYESTYDENNNIIRQKKLDTDGSLAYGTDAFNEAFVFDERGNLKIIENRDEKGNLRNDNTGISYIKYDYDIRDNIISIKRYNQDEIPTWGKDEYFQMVSDFDSIGREIFSATYYPDYVLKFDEEMWGASRYVYSNDTTRTIINVDAYNETIADKDSVSYILEIMNSKKQTIEKRYYNNKKQFSIKEKIPVVSKYKFDERDNLIENVTFDSLLNYTPFEEDVVRVRWAYDKNNNKIKTSYFNEKGELADANQNASFNFYAYDENNYLIKRENYDKNMQPVEVDGIYKFEILVNNKGSDSIVKHYGADNKLKTGASIEKYFYDKYQNLIAITYFDENNRPILNDFGVHKIQIMYDKYSKYIGENYFDVKLQPIEDAGGYHSYRLVFDNRNYIVSESYYDAQNNKVNSIYGYHKMSFVVNEQGLNTRVTYLGSNNNKVALDDGIADYLYQRFSSGMISRHSFYNEEGYLVNDSEGVAEYYYKPNLNGLYYLSKNVDSEGTIIDNMEEIQ